LEASLTAYLGHLGPTAETLLSHVPQPTAADVLRQLVTSSGLRGTSTWQPHVSPEASMARSDRIILRNMKGTTRHNRNWDAISQESAVVITAAQWQFSGGVFGAAGRPVLGQPGQEPTVHVTNVGPHGKPDPGGEAGGVEFLLHAESDTSIDVMITITVLDPVESTEVIG